MATTFINKHLQEIIDNPVKNVVVRKDYPIILNIPVLIQENDQRLYTKEMLIKAFEEGAKSQKNIEKSAL